MRRRSGALPPGERGIVVSDLFCLYPMKRATVAALRGLNLRVEPGERLVVHGPNGSGKTSLLRVLMGEIAPSAGSVRIGGVDLAGANERTQAGLRRTRLGVVDQHSSRVLRPELDVLDNIGLQLTISGVNRAGSRRAARELLDLLDSGELADRRPDQLSGGQAQRVAVCAALAHRPLVILADEPSGELDIESAEQVYDLLASAAQQFGSTLLVVSHDARAGRVADRVVRIRDGRLSEQWSPATPGDEQLVVDDRGWVRLPESARISAGAVRAVHAQVSVNQIVLTGQDRPGEIDTGPIPAPKKTAAGEPVAVMRGISLRYGLRQVLSGVDLALRPGTVTVLCGRSGSGKSTLLQILLGLIDPDAGTVEIAGTAMTELSRIERAQLRRTTTAVALQFGALAESLDIAENLLLAMDLRALDHHDEAIRRALKATNLSSVANRAVQQLSGGERQRVALARSLVVHRPLLVLDEPTSAQDEAHAELVGQALRAAADDGCAVLAATHDPRLVAVADDVVNLIDRQMTSRDPNRIMNR